jgi:hypothetical protein
MRRVAAVTVLVLCLQVGCDEAEARNHEPAPRAEEFRSGPVDAALDSATEVVRTRGFSQDGDDWRGFVVQRDTKVTELPMRAGSCYVVIAAGSDALRELGLRLFDTDGGEVARGVQAGSRNALHHCPPQSGTHYLGVRAATGNGLFAVRRFRGPTGLDVRLDDIFPPPAPPPGGATPERP